MISCRTTISSSRFLTMENKKFTVNVFVDDVDDSGTVPTVENSRTPLNVLDPCNHKGPYCTYCGMAETDEEGTKAVRVPGLVFKIRDENGEPVFSLEAHQCYTCRRGKSDPNQVLSNILPKCIFCWGYVSDCVSDQPLKQHIYIPSDALWPSSRGLWHVCNQKWCQVRRFDYQSFLTTTILEKANLLPGYQI